MNVKRKVSEQAVEGAEQRCSSAGRRGEDSRREGEKEKKKEKTEQQTVFLGSSNKLNMQFGGLRRVALARKRKTKKFRKGRVERGWWWCGEVIAGGEWWGFVPSPSSPSSSHPLCWGHATALDSTRILPRLIPGLSQLSANRQPHKKISQEL